MNAEEIRCAECPVLKISTGLQKIYKLQEKITLRAITESPGPLINRDDFMPDEPPQFDFEELSKDCPGPQPNLEASSPIIGCGSLAIDREVREFYTLPIPPKTDTE